MWAAYSELFCNLENKENSRMNLFEEEENCDFPNPRTNLEAHATTRVRGSHIFSLSNLSNNTHYIRERGGKLEGKEVQPLSE